MQSNSPSSRAEGSPPAEATPPPEATPPLVPPKPPPPPPRSATTTQFLGRSGVSPSPDVPYARLLLVSRRLALALGAFHWRCGSDSPLVSLLSYDALLLVLVRHAEAGKFSMHLNALSDAVHVAQSGTVQTLHLAKDDVAFGAYRWISPQHEIATIATGGAVVAGADGSRQPLGLCGLYSTERTVQRGDCALDTWELRLGQCGMSELQITTSSKGEQKRTVCRGFWGAANTAVGTGEPSDGYLATAFVGCGQKVVSSLVGADCFADEHFLKMAAPGLFVSVVLHVCWSGDALHLWSTSSGPSGTTRLPPHFADTEEDAYHERTSLCPLLFKAVALDGGGVALVSDWARLLGREKQKDGIPSSAEQQVPPRAIRRRALRRSEEVAAHQGLRRELERLLSRQLHSTSAGFTCHSHDVAGHWSLKPADEISSWGSLPIWKWCTAKARWTVAPAESGGEPVATEALSSAPQAVAVHGHPEPVFNGVYIRDHSPCSISFAAHFPGYQISERYPRYVKPPKLDEQVCYLYHASFNNQHRTSLRYPAWNVCQTGWILSHCFGRDQPVVQGRPSCLWSAALPTVGPLPIGRTEAWTQIMDSRSDRSRVKLTISNARGIGADCWTYEHRDGYLDHGVS